MVVAKQAEEWARDRSVISAEAKAIIAQAGVVIAELRAQVVELQAALRQRHDEELDRVKATLALVKDGVPGPPPDMAEVQKLVAAAVEVEVERRMAALPPAAAGRDGIDGKDAEPFTTDQVAAAIWAQPDLLDSAVQRHMAENPPPAGAAGRDGVDGKDAEPLTPEKIADAVEAYLIATPPAAGRDGVDGKDGTHGEHGKDAEPVTSDQIAEAVGAYLVANPPVAGRDGADGKDADLDEVRTFIVQEILGKFNAEAEPMVRSAVAEAVASLPPAEPGPPGESGPPGKDADPEAIGEVVMAQARAMITEEVQAAVKAIPVPQDGYTPTEADLMPWVEQTVQRVVEALPPPKDGEPGRDGNDAPAVEVIELAKAVMPELSLFVVDYLEKHPAAAGKDGEAGSPGRDGIDGKDADPIDREELISAMLEAPGLLEDMVVRYLTTYPPADGKDGAPGQDGAPGRPGAGIRELIIGRDGSLIVTRDDGSTTNLGGVVGKDGSPGKDASLPDVAAMIAVEFGRIQADVSAGRQPQPAPEEVAEKVGKAIYLLNESPPIETFKAWPAQEGQGSKSMAITRDPKTNGLRVQTIND